MLARSREMREMAKRAAEQSKTQPNAIWRSVKYEEVYLRAYDSVSEARNSIGHYLDFYNGKRPHQSFDGATQDQAYFTKWPLRVAA
jgi:putative transposase